MGEERRHPVTDLPRAERGVAIAVRAEGCVRIVDVETAQPIEPDRVVELAECRVERDGIGDVDAGDPPVARVEADPEPRVPLEGVEDRRQLGDRAAHRAARAGGVLQHEPEPVVRQLEQLAEHRDGAAEPLRHSRSEVRPQVEDDALRPDRRRSLERRPHSGDGLLVDLLVRCGQVDEVERVADDRGDPNLLAPFLEPRHLILGVGGWAPHARALREDLHSVAAELLGPVDRIRDPAGRRDVGAEEHGGTLLNHLAWVVEGDDGLVDVERRPREPCGEVLEVSTLDRGDEEGAGRPRHVHP